MIRMQKKPEVKKEKSVDDSVPGSANSPVNVDVSAAEPKEEEGAGGLSLLGIGGKQIKAGAKKAGKKRTPGEIRIQKDISDLDGGSVAQVEFPNPNDLTNFNVIVSPDSGFWSGAKYLFTIQIPALYPHEPPKVTCRTKIYHPNINLEGNVCLNILREEWKPVLDINAVIYGMIYLFYEPNPDDPLNRDAAELYRNDKLQFGKVVKRTLQGQSHAGEAFEKLI
mmetsp:Transcript_25799/g.51722  ORF Transcript_25799/g.51722 Transcript_25799/m.51722 type:complete len:223 (+) Transcript_25799:35-703(+)|eukprot:CAMPEP_0170389796 /NCGR_PEP_ID=MMETSP0117_2-20130122/18806_1 /TAXON_ID=400756 /ORGANISM="Durinskia baltica, Strain CSIRO CS-38" /LENGTH=222 /DNA_ID=CAMNT_0010645803 /DNA_START=38 /DNA_END=706 /DNA_ORIENTATION=+